MGTPMQISVRAAEPDDLRAVHLLMKDLASHEGLAPYFQLSEDALFEYCMGTSPRFHVLVAASGSRVIGYATYLFQFSPWAGREYLFLDDVYVAEEARGSGAGSRLMQQVAEIALQRDVEVRWHVQTENLPAQRFYRALGAELRDRWIAYWTQDAMRQQLDRDRPANGH